MKYQQRLLLLSGICYLSTAFVFTLTTKLLWLKYVSFAFTLFYLTIFLLQQIHLPVHKAHAACLWMAALIMGGYTLFCLDTFLFQAWLPLSGMLRYALFDFYLLLSPLFITAGCCFYVSDYRSEHGNSRI